MTFSLSLFLLALHSMVFPATWSEHQELPPTSSGDILFFADVVSFYHDKGSNLEEIYCLVPNDQIEFEERNGSYKGWLALRIEIIDESGRKVESIDNRIDVEASSVEDAKDRSIVQIFQSRAEVRPGRYTVTIVIEDLNAVKKGVVAQILRRHKKGQVEILIDSPDFVSQPLSISDIQFARGLKRKLVSDFGKSGFEILPNPQRLYGLLLPELAIYAEIYAWGGVSRPDSAAITYAIINRQGARIFEGSSIIAIADGSTPHTAIFDITSLASGSYSLLIAASDASGRSASTQKKFDVVWSPLSWGRYDYETFGDLEYIMTDSEIAEFKRLSPGNREAYLEAFWAKLDPTPGTAENEVRAEHYRRVVYADKHFSTSTKRGALTDRGRIYIKYGPPDEIESRYSDIDFVKSTRQMEGTDSPIPTDPYTRAGMEVAGSSQGASVSSETEALTGQTGGVSVHGKSYEIWTYEGEGKPLRKLYKRLASHPRMMFILVDERGIGDYKVVYSTERGEY